MKTVVIILASISFLMGTNDCSSAYQARIQSGRESCRAGGGFWKTEYAWDGSINGYACVPIYELNDRPERQE